jgi:hypothetical protein
LETPKAKHGMALLLLLLLSLLLLKLLFLLLKVVPHKEAAEVSEIGSL